MSKLDELRAGLRDLETERDKAQGGLIRLERVLSRADLSGGTDAAIATLTDASARADATRRVVGALAGQIADLQRQISAEEEAEAERVRQAAREEAARLLGDVVKAALAMGPLLDKLGDASRRGGQVYHGAGALAAGLADQLRAWEADDATRAMLGMKPRPTDRERELVEARANVDRARARLAELRKYPSDTRVMGMVEGMQSALTTAEARVAALA